MTKTVKAGGQAPNDPAAAEQLRLAQEAIAEMAGEFRVWAGEDVASMRAAYDAASACGGGKSECLSALFESAHNLKGQGGSFGYELLGDVAHSLCEFCRQRTTATPAQMDVIGRHLAALEMILTQDLKGDGGDMGRSLKSGLHALSEKFR